MVQRRSKKGRKKQKKKIHVLKCIGKKEKKMILKKILFLKKRTKVLTI